MIYLEVAVRVLGLILFTVPTVALIWDLTHEVPPERRGLPKRNRPQVRVTGCGDIVKDGSNPVLLAL